jgi:hypothetical protein
LLVTFGAVAAVAAGAVAAILAIGHGGGGSGTGPGGLPLTAPPHTTRTQAQTTPTTPATTPSATTTTPSSASCSVTDDSGRSWTITLGTPDTTSCPEATGVWTQYRRKVAQTKFGFQNVGDWNCRPGHCYKGVPPDPQYAEFDAKPA